MASYISVSPILSRLQDRIDILDTQFIYEDALKALQLIQDGTHILIDVKINFRHLWISYQQMDNAYNFNMFDFGKVPVLGSPPVGWIVRKNFPGKDAINQKLLWLISVGYQSV